MAPPKTNPAYTLLEVLLALGVIAVLMGIAVPFLSQSFGKSQGDQLADEIAAAASAARSGAINESEARRIQLLEAGLASPSGSVRLPKGWRLEVRRLTESKFRKPEKNEFWTFNSAGICEPLTLRLSGGNEVIEMSFDPLTGLVLEE